MSIMLGKHLAGGVLPVEVRVAIMTAVHKMYILAEAKPHPAVVERLLRRLQLRDFDLFYREGDNFLEDLLEEEIKLNPNLREELGIDHRALAEAARDFIGPVSDPSKAPASDFELRHLKASRIAADLFFNLVTGYGGVFSGSDSLYDVLSQDVVGLDWEKLAEGADDILESVMMMAEAGAIAYARKGSEKALDLTRTIPHATYSDEEGKAMEGEMHTTAKANRIRTRRASHGVDFEAVQYEIQTKNVGGVGTAHRSHAEEIELGVGARIIFKQPEDETFLHDHFSRRGISDQYVARLPKLEEGQAMLYVPGKKPLFYNHVLSPSIAPLTRTVAAREQMNTHVPLTQQKGWAERMARMENVMIGLDQSDHG